MPTLIEEARTYIGKESAVEVACNPVEPSEARRYAQAIMDDDPIYRGDEDSLKRYGGPVAPLFFPTHMFRLALGEKDPLDQSKANPDFDGSSLSATQGLPEIAPIKHLAILNGGSETEFYRFARHGEKVRLKSRYANIVEKQSSSGSMIIVTIESDYIGDNDSVLCRVRRTYLRR